MCVWLHVYSFTGTHDCSVIFVLKHISPFEFSLPKFMHQFLFLHHILDGALSVTLSGLFVSLILCTLELDIIRTGLKCLC